MLNFSTTQVASSGQTTQAGATLTSSTNSAVVNSNQAAQASKAAASNKQPAVSAAVGTDEVAKNDKKPASKPAKEVKSEKGAGESGNPEACKSHEETPKGSGTSSSVASPPLSEEEFIQLSNLLSENLKISEDPPSFQIISSSGKTFDRTISS